MLSLASLSCIWDKLLGLNLFPSDVSRTETEIYQTRQNTYGLPLDPRALYSELDGLLWTATLTDNQADFVSFLVPAHKFTNKTPIAFLSPISRQRHGNTSGLSGALRGGRHFHQDASRPGSLEKVGCQAVPLDPPISAI